MSTRIIDVGTADLMTSGEDGLPYRNMLWMSVLQSLGAYQMYRLSVRSNINPADVVNFLLGSKAFPRAIEHCLQVIGASMQALPHHDAAQKKLAALQRRLRRSDFTALKGPALHAYIDDLQLRLDEIHAAIAAAWFRPEE